MGMMVCTCPVPPNQHIKNRPNGIFSFKMHLGAKYKVIATVQCLQYANIKLSILCLHVRQRSQRVFAIFFRYHSFNHHVYNIILV